MLREQEMNDRLAGRLPACLDRTEKSKRIRIWFLWIALIGWMAVIFFFSGMQAADSSRMSGELTRKILSVFCFGFNEMTSTMQATVLGTMGVVIRKAAHTIEYLVLGVLCILSLKNNRRLRVRQVILALMICVAYAAAR